MPRQERPLDLTSTDPIVQFACELRALRREAGNPPYRALAQRAGYSVTTLAEAASGRALPTLAATTAYVRVCGGDTEKWEQRWHSVAALSGPPEGDTAEPAVDSAANSPYVGLTAFEPDDATRFFGRETLVDELVERVARQRFVVVFGASGIGKSSVLRAGLLPRLPHMNTLLLTPGAHPFTECAQALAELTGQPTDVITCDADSLQRYGSNNELLIVVDQFEELFTLCNDDFERSGFIAMLLAAAAHRAGRVRVVIGVRTDFFTHCVRDSGLAQALRLGQFVVGPMTSDQLQSVITQPAAGAGAVVETALLTTLVAECAGEPGVLPLLSHALREAWRRRRGMTMTLAGYRAAGGIEHAVARTAEAVYARCDPHQQQVMKRLFLRLTALGDGTEDTRRRIDRRELDDPDTPQMLDQLVRSRLVTVDEEHIQIAHEALIRNWPRLREWLTQDRDGLRIHRHLTIAAQEWEALGRDDDALYRGARLDISTDWTARGDDDLTHTERAFLTASNGARDRDHAAARRRAQRLRLFVALLSILVLVTGTFAIVAHNERQSALRQQQSALRQRDSADAQRLLAQATALLATNPDLAEQLTLAAYRLAPTTQTASGVLNAVSSRHLHRTSVPGTVLALSPDGRLMTLTDENDVVQLWSVTDRTARFISFVTQVPLAPDGTAAFSPDGSLLLLNGVLANGTTTTQLWQIGDPASPTLAATLPRTAGPVTFGGDDYLVTGRTIWDTSHPLHPRTVGTLPSAPTTAVLSSDGRRLATIANGQLSLWDLKRSNQPRMTWRTQLPADTVTGPVMHGALLAVADGRTIQLWNIADADHPHPVATLQSTSIGITDLTISGDGLELAATGRDGSAEVWNIGVPTDPIGVGTLSGSPDPSEQTAIAGDGRTLITDDSGSNVSTDTDVQWFDLAPAALTLGSPATDDAPAFSSDGGTLTTAGVDPAGDPVIDLWDISRTGFPLPEGTLNADTGIATTTTDLQPYLGASSFTASFSRRGHLLVTPGKHLLRLWDVTDIRRPQPLATLPEYGPAGAPAQLSPNGETLFDYGRLWDLRDPRHPRLIGIPDPQFAGIAAAPTLSNSALSMFEHRMRELAVSTMFSPDSQMLAISEPNRVSLYDISDPAHATPLAHLSLAGPVFTSTGPLIGLHALVTTTFTSNGTALVAIRLDGAVALWDLKRNKLLSVLPGAQSSAAFNTDGRTLALTDARDNSTEIWNITDPSKPTLQATLSDAAPLDFAPDGHVLATFDADGTLQLRETNLQQVITEICATTRRIDRQTWQTYLPAHLYQPSCPAR